MRLPPTIGMCCASRVALGRGKWKCGLGPKNSSWARFVLEPVRVCSIVVAVVAHPRPTPYGPGSRGDGGTIVPLIVPYKSHLVFPMPRMGQTILAMQAMQLLASSGVMAAAGAMISYSVFCLKKNEIA